MTHTLTRSLSATAAIAAVLALGSTSALAQEAAPTIQAPPPVVTSVAPVASAPAAAPAIVLPDVSTVTEAAQTATPVKAASKSTPKAEKPASSTQRTSASRNTAASADVSAPTRTATVAEAPRVAAPAAPSVPAEPARASSANILNANPTRPVAAPAQPVVATAAPADQSNKGIPGEAIAGVLAALGISAVGYAATRSRRRKIDADDVMGDATPLEAEAVPDQSIATAAPMLAARSAPAATEVHYAFTQARGQSSEAELIEREPMVLETPIAPRSTERSRAAFAMPSDAPATAEDRSALLDDMVEAAPDDDNPFVSRKARRKRARLLLQQNENQGRRDAPFDWRTYRSENQPATAARPELITA